MQNSKISENGGKKRWSRAWLKENWVVIRCLYESPASCSASAQVEVTRWLHKPVCEKQRLLSYWTYQNFTSEPVCCCGTFTFGLHSCPLWPFQKTVFSHLVMAGGHCVKFALRVLIGGLKTMLLFSTTTIMTKDLSWHLGIFPLCNIKSITARLLLTEFWSSRKLSRSVIYLYHWENITYHN